MPLKFYYNLNGKLLHESLKDLILVVIFVYYYYLYFQIVIHEDLIAIPELSNYVNEWIFRDIFVN